MGAIKGGRRDGAWLLSSGLEASVSQNQFLLMQVLLSEQWEDAA